MVEFTEFFPMWDLLASEQQATLIKASVRRVIKKGTVIYRGSTDCLGLLLLISGQLRAYILSDEGREVTLYRLFERDICLFSASCMMNSIQFEIIIEAEKDVEFWLIPAEIYKGIMSQSAVLSNYTNEIMASRFSDVMWLMEQLLWKSMDKRLAAFLLEEAALEGKGLLQITHEQIARHLGSAREVITRLLRYFQGEGLVRLRRGSIEILDFPGLESLSA
ncbi:MAG: Crp/Fnr family transcriptional regulator [Bacillota bacterium]|nr:Crp/Fnr family transcriptional regulator [Bacillota bacterium]